MANRPSYKKQDSFGEPSYGQAYEMKPVGGQPQIEELNEGPGPERMGGTVDDKKDMYRLNKVQELQRNFRFLSIFGYSLILGNGWVIAFIAAIIPLTNGGTAGGIWIYFIIIVGLSFSTLSMAEMASMAPTAGGQYHWVSEFAPRSKQRFLSYLTGWLCVSVWCVIHIARRLIWEQVLGWQTALCSTAYSCALAVQGMIALNNPGYGAPAWHGVLLTIAVVLSTIIFSKSLCTWNEDEMLTPIRHRPSAQAPSI